MLLFSYHLFTGNSSRNCHLGKAVTSEENIPLMWNDMYSSLYLIKQVEGIDMQKKLRAEVTEEQVLKRIGGRRNEATAEYLQEAMSLGATLVDPKGIYELFPVAQIEKDRLILENGETFRSEHLCKLLDGAEKIIVMCCTIGPALEKKVKELNEEGNYGEAYFLDVYGATAVGTAMSNLYKELLEELKGYGTTVYMSPGQLDWNIRDQKVVFKLISPEAIGVTLNESNMMNPVKSTTAVFGIGDPAKVKKGNFSCASCPKRNYCTFRHEAEALAM